MVMFIYRDDYYNKDTENKNIAEIIIAKQRNGPIGTVNLVWLPQFTTGRRHQLQIINNNQFQIMLKLIFAAF